MGMEWNGGVSLQRRADLARAVVVSGDSGASGCVGGAEVRVGGTAGGLVVWRRLLVCYVDVKMKREGAEEHLPASHLGSRGGMVARGTPGSDIAIGCHWKCIKSK